MFQLRCLDVYLERSLGPASPGMCCSAARTTASGLAATLQRARPTGGNGPPLPLTRFEMGIGLMLLRGSTQGAYGGRFAGHHRVSETPYAYQ
jgi:hypothetical protein